MAAPSRILRRLLGIARLKALVAEQSGRLDRLSGQQENFRESLEEQHAVSRETMQRLSLLTGLLDGGSRSGTPLAGLVSRLGPFLGLSAPLFLREDGTLALQLARGSSSECVFLVSMPKAGTYLIAALLEALGFVSAGVHASEDSFTDYRWRTIAEMVRDHAALNVTCRLQDTVRLVGPGQFLVGHIGRDTRTTAALRGLTVLFAKRELRASLVSHMRWMANEGRGEKYGDAWKQLPDGPRRMEAFMAVYGRELMAWQRGVSRWDKAPNVLTVRFETLLGDAGEEPQLAHVAALAAHVGVPMSRGDARRKLISVLGRPTKTWSGRRAALDGYWTDGCEKIFQTEDGVALNDALGYRDGVGRSAVDVQNLASA